MAAISHRKTISRNSTVIKWKGAYNSGLVGAWERSLEFS
jgi:hypothetical protein